MYPGGTEYRKVAHHLLQILKVPFPDGRITIKTPYDLVKFVIVHFKPKYIDKCLANIGSIAVPPHRAVELARRGELASYCVRGKGQWYNGTLLTQYEVSFDPSNEVYANWLYVSAGTEVPEIRKLLQDSTLRETWADMVEAALGICQIAERVPALDSLFLSDMQLIRTRLENEVLAFYHSPVICDRISDLSLFSRNSRIPPPYDHPFATTRDFRKIPLSGFSVWSDTEVDTNTTKTDFTNRWTKSNKTAGEARSSNDPGGSRPSEGPGGSAFSARAPSC